MTFANRSEAGRRLAALVLPRVSGPAVVLALPRGGVPVAAEVAAALGAPLDVLLVRKLGVPWQPELGMGAVAEGGVRLLNEHVIRRAGVGADDIAEVEARELAELERRARRYRGGRPAAALAGRTVIVVDDGIATGFTARAACQAARAHGAARVLLAVPVAPVATIRELGDAADEVVCVETPRDFAAIGQFYGDFRQTTDDEVVALLSGAPRPREDDIELPADGQRLPGHLTVPAGARGLVVFAHGSGSSRLSPRNRYVAGELEDAGLGTLLFDLLTPDEEGTRANVFDVELLAGRLAAATDWVRRQPGVTGLPVGYFGASTGAAAALVAAARPEAGIAAIVSRGGRPDLAGAALPAVVAPTLLIVGGRDEYVIELNRAAQARMHARTRLEIIPGATHLFTEPGTLRAAARSAVAWFAEYLGAPG